MASKDERNVFTIPVFFEYLFAGMLGGYLQMCGMRAQLIATQVKYWIIFGIWWEYDD